LPGSQLQRFPAEPRPFPTWPHAQPIIDEFGYAPGAAGLRVHSDHIEPARDDALEAHIPGSIATNPGRKAISHIRTAPPAANSGRRAPVTDQSLASAACAAARRATGTLGPEQDT
jgi:hypothetical protein